jgi:hypothetical protein
MSDIALLRSMACWDIDCNDMALVGEALKEAAEEIECLRAENKAAWDSAIYNAKRARVMEARIEELDGLRELEARVDIARCSMIDTLNVRIEELQETICNLEEEIAGEDW